MTRNQYGCQLQVHCVSCQSTLLSKFVYSQYRQTVAIYFQFKSFIDVMKTPKSKAGISESPHLYFAESEFSEQQYK